MSLKLTWVEMKLFIREPGVYIGLIVPLALLLIFGSIYGNTPNAFFQGRGALDVYMPAYIVMLIVSNAFFSLPIALVNYREHGILFRLQATPLRPLSILASQFGANFLMTTLEAVLLILLGIVFYNLHVTVSVLNVLIAYILGILSIFSLGFLIASLAPNGRVITIFAVVFFLVSIYLSGMAVPLQIYPPTVQQIAQFLPITHAVTLLQELWVGASWSSHWGDVLVLLGLLVVCLALASKLFRWR
ncbi:MAG TPA: ABC transporter permease [Ktedonobacteraceae bacterium]|nr:ABC transporter permease [Ktedonobacteraceae bacterium]